MGRNSLLSSRAVHVILTAAILGIISLSADAATWFVSPQGSDTPVCGERKGGEACRTIQYTIDQRASDGDVIKAAPSTYFENLKISKNITIKATKEKAIIDGGRADTVVVIRPRTNVVLANLVIRNGRNRKRGGGIRNQGTVTLDHCVVTGNSARSKGERPGLGGGLYNGFVANIIASTLSENEATEGGGIYSNFGALRISDSTISNNYSESFGGGMENFGKLWVVNSTFANNQAIYGGAIYSATMMRFSSSTFSGNSALIGGGIYNSQPSLYPTLQNTIMTDNTGSYSSPDCSGNFASRDYNLIGDVSGCSIELRPHDLVGAPTQLGPLSDNGGPTHTMALLPGSAAIDGGNPDGCTDNDGDLLTTDQRGLPRPSPPGGTCDIGSYELQQ
jgi:predicted outer membrane repeat protein